MKKTLAFFIALLMLLQTTACASGNPDSETSGTNAPTAETGQTESTPAEEVPEETETNARDIPDLLPERSFDGKELRIAAEASKEYEIRSEELSGEAENDAIYNRNIVIEERFQAKIKPVVVSNPHDDIVQMVTAGDNPYEISGVKAYQSYIPVFAKVLMSWKDIPFIGFEQPWYYKTTNDNAEINGRLYQLNSYLAISALLDTYAMFFNERICTDYGYSADTLYDLVYTHRFLGMWLRTISSL